MKLPLGVIGTKRVESAVRDAEQADILKVGLNDPPAAAKVFVEATFGEFDERPPHVLGRVRLWIEIGCACDVTNREPRRLDDRSRNLVKLQLVLAHQRRVQ